MQDSSSIPKTALSVTGLNSYLKELLETEPQLHNLWVMGEVSSSHHHPRGLFFTLSDPEGSSSIRCVVWQQQQANLVREPERGEQIVVLGSVRLYPKRGEYQLNVWQALPLGEGLQALRYERLKSRLEAEGLFDLERKRLLPTQPQIVAVVTSPTAAAWGDIQRTIAQRYPYVTLLLSPAIVQGEKAPEAIATAIARVNRDGRAQVIILARGGGAVEDLSCFNDERVVRAIAVSSIPIITGIGHQRDESLADLVADVAVHTPTAAAEMVVPDLRQMRLQHEQRIVRLKEAIAMRLERELEYIQQLYLRLRNIPQTAKSLQQAAVKCQLLKQQLIALDPQAVLQRGYAVVKLADGQIANSTANLLPEQELTLQFARGKARVKILNLLDE